jgi:hypothetical protein
MLDVLDMPVTFSKPTPANEVSGKVKKMLIICSKGKLEDVYAALVLANGALMEGTPLPWAILHLCPGYLRWWQAYLVLRHLPRT